MTEQMPSPVRTFETLQIILTVIILVHAATIGDLGVWDAAFIAGPFLVLTLLISRKRRTWARLTLTIIFVVKAILLFSGLIFVIVARDLELIQGYPFMAIAVMVLQAIALALIYTKPASAWLTSQPMS